MDELRSTTLAFFSSILPLLSLFQSAHAQGSAPAPGPASDGTAIDQGFAYVLLFVALALTYLLH